METLLHFTCDATSNTENLREMFNFIVNLPVLRWRIMFNQDRRWFLSQGRVFQRRLLFIHILRSSSTTTFPIDLGLSLSSVGMVCLSLIVVAESKTERDRDFLHCDFVVLPVFHTQLAEILSTLFFSSVTADSFLAPDTWPRWWVALLCVCELQLVGCLQNHW